MPALPSSLALTNIADGSNIVAADHRNNYSAIQTAVNALISALSGGSAGQVLEALSSSSVDWNGGTYQAYTPTLTASVSNPNLGSTGSAVGRYTRLGKLVHAAGTVTFNGAGIAAGSGTYRIAHPVNWNAGSHLGVWWYFRSSTGALAIGFLQSGAAGYQTMIYPTTWLGAVGNVSDVAPWAPAAGDNINFLSIYEAA